MPYASYYLIFLAASYLLRYPPLLIGVVVFFVLRRFIPDPFTFVNRLSRIGSLRRQVQANPANVTARRDLATMYLDLLRPGRALQLIEEALKRFPDNAELLYLKGVAHLRRGEPDKVLEPIGQALELSPGLRHGLPYLAVGDALMKLRRYADAVQAYTAFVHASSSSIEGQLKLARAQAADGQSVEAKRTIDELFSTWNQIPGYARRKEFGWWMRANLSRLFGL